MKVLIDTHIFLWNLPIMTCDEKFPAYGCRLTPS